MNEWLCLYLLCSALAFCYASIMLVHRTKRTWYNASDGALLWYWFSRSAFWWYFVAQFVIAFIRE